MIDFALPHEDALVVDSIRRFVQRELMPWERELVRRGIRGESEMLTRAEERALQEKARAAGYWGIDTPEEYGGANLAPTLQAFVWMELGRTFIPFRFGGYANRILFDLDERQKQEYLLPALAGDRLAAFALSEPGVGSDARGLRTTAVRNGDEWVVNGEKTWITLGDEADFTILFARTPKEGEGGITMFLVDRAMGYTVRPIRMMGVHDTSSLFFDDVRVPHRNVVGEVNGGFRLAMKFVHQSRIWLAARNVGAAERLIRLGLDHMENRSTFGRKLAERENLQFDMAESEVEARCAKLLVLNAAWRMQQGLDYRQAASSAKLHAARMVNRVVDRVMQLHGAMGYARETGIERFYRDLRVQRIYEGADEIQLATIFRNLRTGESPIGQID
jgi:acyl-CoA dehydrogenase